MLENRRRGRSLGKVISYAYIIMGILVLVVTFMLNSESGIYALSQRGAQLSDLAFGSILYFIFGAALYLLSTRYKNDENLWKIYIVIAVLNFIVIGFSIIIFVFSFLLIVAGDDIRKELN